MMSKTKCERCADIALHLALAGNEGVQAVTDAGHGEATGHIRTVPVALLKVL